MEENFLNVLYIEHTDKIGVLKDDKNERVSIILGTDKTLVERKRGQNVPSCTIDKEPHIYLQG